MSLIDDTPDDAVRSSTTLGGLGWARVNETEIALDGEPELDDIAHALSMQCRFAGHVTEFFSIAQHSLNVCRAVYWATRDPVQALQALLHDGGEFIVGDTIRPIKTAEGMGPFCAMEESVRRQIFAAFDLPAELPDLIRVVDRAAAAAEQVKLRPSVSPAPFLDVHARKLLKGFRAMRPHEARLQFIAAYGQMETKRRTAK